ncbi:MAG: FAD synthetase family protein [Clostridiales bacterium]|nr:FAD synthetase family protein [Clostridiales bacterium]
MKVWDDVSILKEQKNLCIALGTFDGVHVAHRALLESCLNEAEKRGFESVVYTFMNHPSTTLNPDDPEEVLTTLKEKTAIFEDMGFDHLVTIYFDEEFAALTPKAFVEQLLYEGSERILCCGFDYRFGAEGAGDVETLKALSEELHFTLLVQEAVMDGEEIVSSTAIREALRKGNLEKAAQLLGWPYGGTVKDFGREHSGPTARSIYGLMENKIGPRAGDYRIRVTYDVEGTTDVFEAGVYGRNVTIMDPDGKIPYENKIYYVVFEELL